VGNYANYGWDDTLKCFNVDQSEPLITLNFKFPTDINELKGTMDFQGMDNVPFKGLYKVVKVTSEFAQGSFTQILDCVRLNNQGQEVVGAKFEAVDEIIYDTGITAENDHA
jgi:predicted transcriptional regulator